MNEERVAEILAAHADELIGQPEAMRQIHMTDEERAQLAPMFQLAEQLQQNMRPVQPSTTFVRSLGKELSSTAQHQIALSKRLRRATLIGAAAAGSLVSIASLIGAIVFIVGRRRSRGQTQTAHAPTS